MRGFAKWGLRITLLAVTERYPSGIISEKSGLTVFFFVQEFWHLSKVFFKHSFVIQPSNIISPKKSLVISLDIQQCLNGLAGWSGCIRDWSACLRCSPFNLHCVAIHGITLCYVTFHHGHIGLFCYILLHYIKVSSVHYSLYQRRVSGVSLFITLLSKYNLLCYIAFLN